MRTMHLTSPLMHGDDVRSFQTAIENRLQDRAPEINIDADGVFGPESAHARNQAAFFLGVLDPSHDVKRSQAVILHPSLRTPLEVKRGTQRTKAHKTALHTGAAGAVRLALELARKTPHITENPAGSNTDHGGYIDKAQKEVGISASYYCGAGVHYTVLHGGGVNLTPDVRYCPYIINHARAGTGGLLKWMPVSEKALWLPGDILTFEEGGIAGHTELLVEKVTGSEVHTVGWNTSAQGGSGSQSNGGGVFERHRPIGGGFPVMGAARVRWT